MNIVPIAHFRALILAGTAILVGVTTPAYSQTVASVDESAGIEEIIVTAQKRETNLQRTPVSISVLGSDDLLARGVVGLRDLMNGAVPSLRIAPGAIRR